jgi:hypothetical protein
MKIFKIVLASLLVSSVLFIACKKESRTSTLQIKLTDAPAEWEEVNIDLKQVTVNFSNDTTGWISLPTRDSIYNLLDLQNGLDTLIAQGSVPANTLHEVRLVLGDDNSIKVNGQVYPLTIPSGASSGLKIKVNKKLNASIETIVIDFDAGMSVHEEQDGYKLRPVITVK